MQQCWFNSVMGSNSFVFLDWGWQCFSKEKHKTWVCVVSFSYDEMPSASIKQPLVNITYNTFRLCWLLQFCRTYYLSWNSCVWEAWHNRALTQAILQGQYSWLEIKTHCPVFVCFLQTSIVVLFREMSRKMTMLYSNLLTIKYVGLIWFVHQQHIVKITSIKLLTYKVTVKHFICTHNIILSSLIIKQNNVLMKNPRKCLSEYNYWAFFLLHPHGRVIPNSF